MPRLSVSEEDVKNADRLRRKLNDAYEQIYALMGQLDGLAKDLKDSNAQSISRTERAILRALAVGSTENPAASQKASVPTVSSLPPVNSSTPGDLVRFGGTIYIFVDAASGWVTITAAAAAHNLLSATHADTLAGSVVRGDLIVGNSTPRWARLAKGTALQLLRMDSGANDIQWGGVDDGQLTANVALLNRANQLFSGALNRFGGAFGHDGSSGAKLDISYASENLTLSNVAATTDTAANLIAGSGLILGVVVRVTTTISGGGVTNWQVGDTTTPNRFRSTGTALTAGSGAFCMNHWQGGITTDAAGPVEYNPRQVRITCDATPTAGVVRIGVWSIAMTAFAS